jgi:hypothetical protein
MTEQFICAICKGTFNKGWSDEEARQERLEIFGNAFKDEDCVLVCDDCYVKPLSYKELRAKTRKDMADVYRHMRKLDPAIVRMYWKMQKELIKQVTDTIMYGSSK